ncbi:MAG: hypothetical protein AAB383_06190 [Patescibacteria group bacterium]
MDLNHPKTSPIPVVWEIKTLVSKKEDGSYQTDRGTCEILTINYPSKTLYFRYKDSPDYFSLKWGDGLVRDGLVKVDGTLMGSLLNFSFDHNSTFHKTDFPVLDQIIKELEDLQPFPMVQSLSAFMGSQVKQLLVDEVPFGPQLSRRP